MKSNNNKINYLYNAAGQKVEKKVKQGVNIAKTEYLDGYHYQNEKLLFFPTAEGYVSYAQIPELQQVNKFSYVYNFTDHLGNIRLSYTTDPQSPSNIKILEESNYYPFGLQHGSYNTPARDYRPIGDAREVETVDRNLYKYKLKGKEWQDELGLNVYDFGARMYMPDIGRWNGIDAKAEQYRRWSPYNYCVNNPVVFSDPDGMGVETDFYNLKGKKIGADGVDNGVKVVVTDNKEAKSISKTKGNVDASGVKSGVTLPSDTALQESLNVLERTVKNGGLKEESSLVMKDGTVVKGETGSMPTIEDGVQIAKTSLPSIPEGKTTADVEASIYSHPTVVQQVGEQVFPQSASTPSKGKDVDETTFKQYDTNIIVGPLGTLKFGSVTTNPDGSLNVPNRSTGAAIYDSNSTPKVELTKKAIEKILEN